MAAPAVVLLATVSPQLPLVVFGGVALACSFSVLLLPETAGRPLPETIASLEEPKAAVPTGRVLVALSSAAVDAAAAEET